MNTSHRNPRCRAPLAFSAFALGALAFGCASHSKLLNNDKTVSEEEVRAAGAATADPALGAPLVHILEHHADYDTSIVVAALVAVGDRKDASAVGAIDALRTHPSEEVRWHCVLALKQIGDDAARKALAAFASDESAMIREEASENS